MAAPQWQRSNFWYDGKRQFFIVLSVGTDPTHLGFLRFVNSCTANDIPFYILGQGQPWRGGDMTNDPGGGQKVNFLKAGLVELRNAFPDIFANLLVLFTDCYDVCVVASVDEILRKYTVFQGKIVFSTEVSCWPDSELSTQYPLAPDNSPFRYLNSGGFIGPATDILDLINTTSIRDNEDDQRYYTNFFLNPRSTETHKGLTLDYRCEIFQTLNHIPEGSVDCSSPRPRNNFFNTEPCFFHANGSDHVARFFDHLSFEQRESRILSPLNNKINHIIVINMAHHTDKRAFIEQQLQICLQEYPAISVEFFVAINGMTITPRLLGDMNAKIDETWLNPYSNKPLTHGEVGCALSHHAVWTKIRDGNWSNVLVIEDDVIIPPDLITKLETFMGELTEPWDLAYVGRKPLRHNEYRLSEHVVVPKYSYWTNAYVLNPAGANKLLATDYLQRIIPVDEYLPLMYHSHFNALRLNHYCGFAPLLAVAFDPLLIRPIDETFQESDTEISPLFGHEKCLTMTYDGLLTPIPTHLITELRREFATTGYVKLPRFLSVKGLHFLKQEGVRLAQFVTPHNFVMEEYDTIRKLGTIGGRTISVQSPFLSGLYTLQIIQQIIETIVGNQIYPCQHPNEFMVMNYLSDEGDTHGWHLDDPAYALIIFIESPSVGEGGEVELIPHWKKVCEQFGVLPDKNIPATIELCRKNGIIQSKYHAAGDAYLIRADQCMHQVSKINTGQQRIVLNIAFESTATPHYGNTATKLYE